MFSSADLIQLLEMFSSCFAVHALTCCMYINNCDRVTSVRNNFCDIVHSLIPLKSSGIPRNFRQSVSIQPFTSQFPLNLSVAFLTLFLAFLQNKFLTTNCIYFVGRTFTHLDIFPGRIPQAYCPHSLGQIPLFLQLRCPHIFIRKFVNSRES